MKVVATPPPPPPPPPPRCAAAALCRRRRLRGDLVCTDQRLEAETGGGATRGVKVPSVLLEGGGRDVRRRVGRARGVPRHRHDQPVRAVASACTKLDDPLLDEGLGCRRRGGGGKGDLGHVPRHERTLRLDQVVLLLLDDLLIQCRALLVVLEALRDAWLGLREAGQQLLCLGARARRQGCPRHRLHRRHRCTTAALLPEARHSPSQLRPSTINILTGFTRLHNSTCNDVATVCCTITLRGERRTRPGEG